MKKLFQKDPVWFAVVWILIYVLCFANADSLSETIGIPKLLTVIVGLVLSVLLFGFLRKNSLLAYSGLCKSRGKGFLWLLPLIVISTVNFWNGLTMNMPVLETVLYILSMCCVGFLEEVIFRGLLFNAMRKDGLRSAVIVSSLTFGIGHIVNLFNGSGVQLLSNLCQVGYATAVGFLFVILFLKTGSLIPCIITHSVVNALSVFANKGAITAVQEIFSAIAIAVIALAYSVYLLKKLPE